MAEDKDLEQFKLDFTQGFIDPHLDALLDLRNSVKKAETYNEVRKLMNQYRAFMLRELGLEETKEEPKKVVVNETKERPANTHET